MKKLPKPANGGQLKDQASKGGILALIMYIATKNDVDPEFIALSMPILSGILAYLSSLIGDKELASFFDK